MPTTETVEYLFRTMGLDEFQRELVATGNAADATEADVDALRAGLRRLDRQQDRTADSSRRLSQGIRGIEGAGRIFGGAVGEAAGVLGDLEIVAEGAGAALGPAGLAGAFGLLAAVAVPVALIEGARLLATVPVDIARGAIDARDALEQLGAVDLLDSATAQGLDRLDDQLARLDVSLSRLAAEVGPAVVPVVEALANAAERLANLAASPLLDQLANIDASSVGALAGGVSGGIGGAITGAVTTGGLLSVPLGIAGAVKGSELGAAFAAPAGTGVPSPRRSLLDLADDLTSQASERAATSTRRVAEEADNAAEAFAGAELDVTAFARELQAAADAQALLALTAAEADAAWSAAIPDLVDRLRGGETGGRVAGRQAFRGVLEQVPVLGPLLGGGLDVLADLPGFFEGLIAEVVALPVSIVQGLATTIAEVPAQLIAAIPDLVVGLVEGIAQLILSPIALIEGVIDAILALPSQLAQALIGLPVRLLDFIGGGGFGEGGLLNTGLFDLNKESDRGGLFGTGALAIFGGPGNGGLFNTGFLDLSPKERGGAFGTGRGQVFGRQKQAAQAAPAQPPSVVFAGWGEAMDNLQTAVRTRRAFAAGNAP